MVVVVAVLTVVVVVEDDDDDDGDDGEDHLEKTDIHVVLTKLTDNYLQLPEQANE